MPDISDSKMAFRHSITSGLACGPECDPALGMPNPFQLLVLSPAARGLRTALGAVAVQMRCRFLERVGQLAQLVASASAVAFERLGLAHRGLQIRFAEVL